VAPVVRHSRGTGYEAGRRITHCGVLVRPAQMAAAELTHDAKAQEVEAVVDVSDQSFRRRELQL
jgi:hypothetical protein